MIADLILDMLSKEKTFAVVQDALSRIFITVVVLGVTSTLLTVSSTVSTRKVLVGMACTKILISSGFITRICLFDQKIFPVRMTCFMSAVVIVNAGLRLYTATTQRSRANETACIASSALLLVFSFMLFVQFIVNFIRKFRSKGYEKLAPHDGISLAFVVTYVVFVMGDVIVTYSHGLYSGLLTDASPGCLSSIIYILAGSMISMNIAEGRHVRAMIVDAKVKQYQHPLTLLIELFRSVYHAHLHHVHFLYQ